jgi:hypothetical protein
VILAKRNSVVVDSVFGKSLYRGAFVVYIAWFSWVSFSPHYWILVAKCLRVTVVGLVPSCVHTLVCLSYTTLPSQAKLQREGRHHDVLGSL